jgi:hypothetical protein
MGEPLKILPGTGTVVGAHRGAPQRLWAPSTTPLCFVVPLPVPGRI